MLMRLDELDRHAWRTASLVVSEEDEDLSVDLGDTLPPRKCLLGAGDGERVRLQLGPEIDRQRCHRNHRDGLGESGVGCLGSYKPSSPPPGNRMVVMRPKPSSLTGPLNSTPLSVSSALVL